MNAALLWAGTYFDEYDDLGSVFGCSWDEDDPMSFSWWSNTVTSDHQFGLVRAWGGPWGMRRDR